MSVLQRDGLRADDSLKTRKTVFLLNTSIFFTCKIYLYFLLVKFTCKFQDLPVEISEIKRSAAETLHAPAEAHCRLAETLRGLAERHS